MSEKQVTVAELLARAGKDKDRPARRRRRSTEEGGISVAELTGSIPRVNAKPATGKHSEPLDPGHRSHEVSETPEELKAKAEEAVKAVEQEASEAQEAAKPEAKAAEDPAKDEVGEAAKPEVKVAEEPAKDETKEPEKPQPQVAVKEPAKPASPSTDETMVLSVVDENEPLRLTTDTFPAVTPEVMDEVGVDKQEEPEAETAIMEVPVPDVSEEVPEEAEATTATDAAEEEESVSALAVAMMAIIGIVLGVAVFKGFEILWANLNGGLVAVLAIAVTAAMVGVVHVMRTNRDRLSMVLAAVVTLVMTFGPLATI